MDLNNKRLLILGGNPETGALVRYANDLGVHTIVVDPIPNAPAKKDAKESYEVEVMNLDLLIEKAKELNLDGILVGVADILVPSYYKVCKALNFPCYATQMSLEVLTTKNGFRDKCEASGIGVIPYYPINKELSNIEDLKIQYPVLVKPVDNGAGVGMNISTNKIELLQHISIALSNSKRKEFIVERYMDCEDMLVYYTISNGEAYLSAAADRYTTKSQAVGSPVCVAARYPSKHLNRYMESVNKNVQNMISSIGIRDGVLNIQFFVDKNNFYAYDPGFRLQGEAPHLYLNKILGFDNRKMLINFALTSSDGEPELAKKNDPYFKQKYGCTLWILLKVGVIGDISGLDSIREIPNIFQIIQRLYKGDTVTKEMAGTERQVFARFYIVSETELEQAEVVLKIQERLQINNESGDNMILENFDTNKFKL